MKTITFGSRTEANEIREKASAFLDSRDDRRKKTVRLSGDVPERIVDRLESEAFASQESDGPNAGMSQLSESERATLARSSGFQWQEHGFQAMRAKAALEAKGATEWTDFYEPGEGATGAVQNLRQSKKRSASTGSSIGVGGQRTDEEEMTSRRQRRQVERAQSADVDRAIVPAFSGDEDAIGFLREEEQFGSGDLFDISLRSADAPAGRDYERLEGAHAERSKRARRVDERRSARVTRDPLEWAANPGRVDFPGIDTVSPEKIHARRSKRARKQDEREFAPIADSRQQWAANPDRYDWPGVDVPRSYGATMGTPVPQPEAEMGLGGGLFPGASESVEALGEEDEFLTTGGWKRRRADVRTLSDENDDELFAEMLGGGEPTADDLDGAYGSFSDDRDRDGTLAEFGMETDGSTYRESRQDVESATAFGVDDRSTAKRGPSTNQDKTAQEMLFGDSDGQQGGLF